MSLLKNYIQNFLSSAGSYVFIATIVARVLSFISSWIALQLIPNQELGIVLFAYSIVAFLLPFSDLGLHQSLIRFGALMINETEKNNLFMYVCKKGIVISICLIALVALFSVFFPFKYQNTGYYLALLSVSFLPLFIFNIIQIQFRLQHNNKNFSKADIVYNSILLVSITGLSYFFKEIGYIIAIIIAPLITSLIFFKKLNISQLSYEKPKNIINFSFWKYGFYSGVTSVVTNLLLVIDILLIGHLISDSEMITVYKYVSLIPLSLVFISQSFITTDFVTFTENIKNKKYIFKYIKGYVLLFTLISIFICFCGFFFSNIILKLFNEDFINYADSFFILTIGICGILIFRGLFGNLLCSIGKIEVNSYIIAIALMLNVVGNYYFIPIYGIKGAAITSAILMWFTGIFSGVSFLYLYKKMPHYE